MLGFRPGLLATIGVAAIGVSATPATAAVTPTVFSFTGAEQTYTVPAGVTTLAVTAVGAPGGKGIDGSGPPDGPGGAGADGANVTAELPVTPGETLFVEVGGPGGAGSGSVNGGFNGGGAGSGSFLGGGGGGASDVRTAACGGPCPGSPSSLHSRLLVAGGGGGGGGGFSSTAGGAGGGAASVGFAGGDVPGSCGGKGGGGAGASTGGSAGTGGAAGSGPCPPGIGASGTGGAIGIGGAGGNGADDGGGGGGGLFGGGGGGGGNTSGGGGGGGGSSFGPTGTTFSQDTTGTPSVTIAPNVALASVSSPSLSFAAQKPGTISPPQTITVSSVGSIPLAIANLSFAGANPGDFLIGSSTCGVVAVGQECNVTVRFVPSAIGQRSAMFEIATNDRAGPATVAVSGVGFQPPSPTSNPGKGGTAKKLVLVTCTTTTKTVVRHGHKARPKFTKCKAKPVTRLVKPTTGGKAAHASLSRGPVTYATGMGSPAGRGRERLILHPVRRLRPGRYTLTLRRHGRPTRREQVTIA